jgi:NADPH:quinone reductase-like Zn-dependent oxidoreductase
MTTAGSRLVFRETGKPEAVLAIEQFELLDPAAGEVRVRMIAAPVNPADLNTIEGTYGVKPPLPATPGIEGVGVVEESGAADFDEGDVVIFLKRSGTWATHVTVPAEVLFKLPKGIDPLQAAMLKVNPATAWQLLRGFGSFGAGDWVVQNAGNSAVGRCVIQLAQDFGIRTLSFVRRAELVDELKSLGADAVFVDDEEGRAAAKELLGGANAVLAFNAVGGDSALGLLKLVREGGSHITYGAMGRRPVTVPNGLLIFRDVIVRGLWVTRWLERASEEEAQEIYGALAEKVAAGKILQKVDSIFPLEDFQKALARLEESGRDGKVLFGLADS